MKQLCCTFILLMLGTLVQANDGVFYTSGNHLIPMHETSISVRKEILFIKKMSDCAKISVYYEFFNPGDEKTLTVGFEAEAPSGDASYLPIHGNHPNIRNFTVNANGANLPYRVAYVTDSNYFQDNTIQSLDIKQIEADTLDRYSAYFDFVYYFKMKFKKGVNIVKHNYTYDLSGSVYTYFELPYKLTTANRWANKQIDDFQLIIDPGELQSFYIDKDFFDTAGEWLLTGVGRTTDCYIGEENSFYENRNSLKFNIYNGLLVFNKKNFSPRGEINMFSLFIDIDASVTKFNEKYLPFGDEIFALSHLVEEGRYADIPREVLRNLPFARRGYVFKNKTIQDYYEKNTDWYIANPNYYPVVKDLMEDERKWMEIWK